jgi:hypothetical protein
VWDRPLNPSFLRGAHVRASGGGWWVFYGVMP